MKQKVLFILASLTVLMICLCGCGNSGVETVDGADERVADAYKEAYSYYSDKETYEGFWEISAAYSCIGDDVQGHSFDLSGEDENQRGAIILSLLMMGEDPYHYEGKDLIADLLEHGTGGSFAIPVFNFLALQAAAADMDDKTLSAYIDYSCEKLTDFSMGPDIGGWAAVSLVRYADDPRFEDQIKEAVKTYSDTVSENLSCGTMGSDGITYGCVVMGLTAFANMGLNGFDVSKDSPWIDNDPLALMYDNLTDGEENVSDYYKNQYNLDFADFYRVIYADSDMAWISCGITADKLSALMEEAKNSDDQAVREALSVAENLSHDELSSAVPTWGKTYFDLFHAMEK